MKYQITKILLLVLIGFTAWSCKKDRLETQPVTVKVQLKVDPADIWFEVPFQKSKVTLTNKATNSSYNVEADNQGKIELNNIVPGVYSLNVSLELTGAEYTELTGNYREDEFYLNSSMDNIGLFKDETFDVQLVAGGSIGNFVIKQVYYAGSHTTRGANIRDQFIEVYNNSADVLYADSLLIAVVFGKQNNTADEFSLSNNQFDWSKSVGMNAPGNANEDYIYTKALFMIPSDGTGKKYPVQPGQSIVIAGTAVNHSASYTNNAGNTIGAQEPELTIDLSNADFEVWLYPYEQEIQPGRTMFASDVDNPDVPDVKTFFATGMRDLIFNPQGRDAYAILKVDGSVNLNNLPDYAIPTVINPTTSTVRYPQLPAKFVLDAVEVEAVVSADRVPRKLSQKLDAGAISIIDGPYSSQSIVRKTHKTVNGRRILKDTNNSTQDFGVLSKANPSKNAASFID